MANLTQPVTDSVKQAAMEKANIFGRGGRGRAYPKALARIVARWV